MLKKILSFVMVLCMILTLISAWNVGVYAAAWHSGWSLSGGAIIKGSEIVVSPSPDKLALAQTKWQPVGGKFDIEWEMSANTSVSNASFAISTGTHRAYFVIMEKGITYHASDFDTNGTIKTISHDIYDDTHTYRLVGEGGYAEFYVDGYYLGTLDLRPWTEEPWIKASIGASGGKIVLKNVTIHPVKESSKEEEVKQPPTEAFRLDFEDGEDYSNWSLGESWYIKDGYLQSNNNISEQRQAQLPIVFDGDFIFKAKVRAAQKGFLNSIILYWPGAVAQVDIKPDKLDISNDIGRKVSETIDIGTEWHEYTIETSDNMQRYTVYLDGIKYIDSEVDLAAHTMSQIRFNVWGYPADPVEFYADWISYEPKWGKQIRLVAPMEGAEYLEGEKIQLAATVEAEEKPETIDYKVNGKTVATGKAPDYKAVIDGLSPAYYEVLAEGKDLIGTKTAFKVLPSVSGTLEAEENQDGDLVVKSEFYDEFKNIGRVEYLLDGIQVGEDKIAPFDIVIKNVNPGRHQVTATAYSKSGICLGEMTKSVLTGFDSGKVSMSYANEICYTITGESGSAVYELKNGNHQLKLTHTPEAITYLTDIGEETFANGTGNFTILTEGPTADVYRNGQLAFSFYLPQTNEVGASVEEKGLKFENESITVPEERKTYFVKRDIASGQEIYSIPDMPYIYNLDFVANKEDDLRLVVNDGYFKMDLTMEDGKFYAWTTKDDNTDPYKTYLADASGYDEDTYFRVETAGGMSRLYGNGRWLASFRGIHSVANNTLAVDVKQGSNIRYLSLNDNNDVYLYQDDFRNTAEFDSEQYWYPMNDATYLVDDESGLMILDALGKKNAGVDIFAFSGHGSLSADVEIKKANGGVWFTFARGGLKDYYTKIGYNYKTEQYEVVGVDRETETVLATAEGTLTDKGSVHMELKICELDTERKTATLYVDGVPVITQESANYMRGRMGIFVDDAFLYLKNASYRGDAKPLAGVSEFHSDAGSGNSLCFLDLIETEEKLLLVGYGKRFASYDNGKTWVQETAKAEESYDNVRLDSGKILSAKYFFPGTKDENGSAIKSIGFYYSEDDGETFEMISQLPFEKVDFGHKQNSMKQGPSGRIYFLVMESSDEDYGTCRIFYSDDEGKNWTESIFIDGKELNLTIGEATIIEYESGVTHCYFRSNTGFISYFESLDRGETWDLTTVHSTPFFSPASMFNVDYDSKDKGTVYMGWNYDNAALDARVQFNRHRWGMAKTTDGKTWEFLGTYHENNNGWNNYMNLNIQVADNAVILEAPVYADISYSKYTALKVTQDRTMEKPVKKFERLHMKDLGQIAQVEVVRPKVWERTMVIHPKTGNALLSGALVEGIVSDQYILLDYAAAFVGAKVVSDDDNGVTLQLADTKDTVAGADLLRKDNKTYIKAAAFAELYSLTLTDKDGIMIISPYTDWSRGQIRAFRYSVDLLTNEL